jgi:hypothetical protein
MVVFLFEIGVKLVYYSLYGLYRTTRYLVIGHEETVEEKLERIEREQKELLESFHHVTRLLEIKN